MSKYFIKSINTDFKAVLEYTEADTVKSVEFENATQEQLLYFFGVLAQSTDIEYIKSFERLRVTPAQEDLSFKAFWDAFRYKVGKKARAERLWNAMTDAEKQAAFFQIKLYHQFIAIKNQESAYPETWLYNRMWECEYKL